VHRVPCLSGGRLHHRADGQRRRRPPLPLGGVGGMSLVLGVRWSGRGQDAGSPRIDVRYGGERDSERGCVGPRGAARGLSGYFANLS
jgi:hypothetical protein